MNRDFVSGLITGCLVAITVMMFLAGFRVNEGLKLLEEIKACQCEASK